MKKIALVIIGLAFLFNAQAQIEATTTDGKKVYLYDDRTWKYAPEENVEMTPDADCLKFITIEEDKMTGAKKYFSKKKLVISYDEGESGFGIFCDATGYGVKVTIQAVGSGKCINDDHTIIIRFRDGSTSTMENDVNTNCQNQFVLKFGGDYEKEDQISLLKSKPIETIRIYTQDGFVQEDLTPEMSDEFMSTVGCLWGK